MRKLFSIVSVFLLFFACDNTSSYKITGSVSSDSMNGKTIYLGNYLWYMKLSDKKVVDSAVINGKQFEFKGKTDSAYIALLVVDGRSLCMLFVENGNINIDISEEPNANNIATGTELNDKFRAYNQNMEPVRNKMQKLMQDARSQETEELGQEFDSKYEELSKEMLQLSIKFLDENPGTVLSALILLVSMSQGVEVEVLQNTYDKLNEQVKNGALGQIIAKEIKREKIKDIEIGEIFRDLTLKTPEGKDISISDYAGKGKYVLLDFWASWCGPCRAENPNVVALYNKYKDKGFEIVGVSMDDNKDNWIKGIESDGITWPQMSDLKGWDSEAAFKYRVQGIPFTVLLDKDGKVIATNLRGEELANKIRTLIQ
jgi:thiol-disulfide isomerase/thioredoxin